MIDQQTTNLLKAAKAALPFVSRWHETVTAQIGDAYDKVSPEFKEAYPLSGTGFFDLLDEGNELRNNLRDAILEMEMSIDSE